MVGKNLPDLKIVGVVLSLNCKCFLCFNAVSELNLAAVIQSLKTLIYPSFQAVTGVDLGPDSDLAQGDRRIIHLR